MMQAQFATTVMVVLSLNLSACAHRPEGIPERNQRINTLSVALQALSPEVGAQEAYRFAATAVTTAAGLREKYGVRLAPWLHNLEVNRGKRPRGLCIHYAVDLFSALEAVPAPHLTLHLIRARPHEIREHTAISITAHGQPWYTGLVLDAWRHGGILYFGAVTRDKYPWQPIRQGRSDGSFR